MTDLLTESLCERCGTRFTFGEPPRARRLSRLKLLSRGLKGYVLSDGATLRDALGEAKNEDHRHAVSRQLESFQDAFSFCLSCRQYLCHDCWNGAAGRCVTCAPLESPAADESGPEARPRVDIPTAEAPAAAPVPLREAFTWPEHPSLPPRPLPVSSRLAADDPWRDLEVPWSAASATASETLGDVGAGPDVEADVEANLAADADAETDAGVDAAAEGSPMGAPIAELPAARVDPGPLVAFDAFAQPADAPPATETGVGTPLADPWRGLRWSAGDSGSESGSEPERAAAAAAELEPEPEPESEFEPESAPSVAAMAQLAADAEPAPGPAIEVGPPQSEPVVVAPARTLGLLGRLGALRYRAERAGHDELPVELRLRDQLFSSIDKSAVMAGRDGEPVLAAMPDPLVPPAAGPSIEEADAPEPGHQSEMPSHSAVEPEPTIDAHPIELELSAEPEPLAPAVVEPAATDASPAAVPAAVPAAPAAEPEPQNEAGPASPPLPPEEVWWIVAPDAPTRSDDIRQPLWDLRSVPSPVPHAPAAPTLVAPGFPPSAARPTAPLANVWAASSREVVNRPGSGVQVCRSCALPLSASARFCRRCGSPQA
ncbi:MAG: hypothetical protein FJ038_09465 [Chloroflexi bacterium]|nr:hypothetical protein [Chloroflexota bacterium]